MYYRVRDIAEILGVTERMVAYWTERDEGQDKLHTVRKEGSSIVYIDEGEFDRFVSVNSEEIEDSKERADKR